MKIMIGSSVAAALVTLSLVTHAQDSASPTLQGLRVTPNVIDVSASAVSVAVQADVFDNLSGWNWGYLQFVSPTGGSYVASFSQLSGTPLNGTVNGSVAIPRYAPAGSYKYDVVLSDSAGNMRVYGYSDLLASGYSSLLTVNSLSDSLGPTVSALDVQPKVIDSRFGSNLVTVSATMSDDLSGWAWGYLQFVSPTGSSFVASLAPIDATGPLTVVLQGSVTIPQYAPFGAYSYDLVSMDAAGNLRVYHTADLVTMGWNDLLTIQAIPEPSTAKLMMLGALVIVMVTYRRQALSA